MQASCALGSGALRPRTWILYKLYTLKLNLSGMELRARAQVCAVHAIALQHVLYSHFGPKALSYEALEPRARAGGEHLSELARSVWRHSSGDHVLVDERPHALHDGGGVRRRVEARTRALLLLLHSLQRD